MASKRQPTKPTTPKETEIPIPTRSDLFRDVGKVAATEERPSGHTKWSEIKRRKAIPTPN